MLCWPRRRIIIKFIADALKASKPAGKKDLVFLLSKNLGRYWPERSHHTVHASDVTKPGFCARQYRIMDMSGMKRPDRWIPAGLKATFDVGNATASLMRNQWAGDYAIGHWDCTTCGKSKLWQSKPGQGCAAMSNCSWVYREVEFVHPQSKLSGSIDVMMTLGQTKVTAIEIKIIKVDDFEKLVMPLGEHRARTRLYLRLIAESQSPYKGMIDTEHAKVLYISRGFGKKNPDASNGIVPFKEYDVFRDDQSVQPYFDLAQSVADARESGGMPMGVCDSITCVHAKSCPVRKECFSGEYGHQNKA